MTKGKIHYDTCLDENCERKACVDRRNPVEIFKKAANREAFNDWFTELLLSQGTCLLRDVLRDSKEVIWKHWQEREPIQIREGLEK